MNISRFQTSVGRLVGGRVRPREPPAADSVDAPSGADPARPGTPETTVPASDRATTGERDDSGIREDSMTRDTDSRTGEPGVESGLERGKAGAVDRRSFLGGLTASAAALVASPRVGAAQSAGRTKQMEALNRWVIAVAPPAVVETVADEPAGAVDRGVLVLLVTDVGSLSLDRPLEALATVVRTRESPQGFQEFGLGADTVRSLMVSRTARLGDDRRYSPALYLDDATIGVWTNDSLFAIERRLAEERLVPDPPALPRRSESFRRVVLDAALHRRAGTDPWARVEGRSVADGAATTVGGCGRSDRG